MQYTVVPLYWTEGNPTVSVGLCIEKRNTEVLPEEPSKVQYHDIEALSTIAHASFISSFKNMSWYRQTGHTHVPSSLKCFARGCGACTFDRVFSHEYVFLLVFSNYVEDYSTLNRARGPYVGPSTAQSFHHVRRRPARIAYVVCDVASRRRVPRRSV